MNMLRKQFKQYDEFCYLAFIFLMSCCAGLGYSSYQLRYIIIFAIASIFLGIKVWITEYTRSELLWMVILAAVAGVVFLINRQKTIIISLMAIFGMKHMKFDKVFRFMLYPRLAATTITIILAVMNIIPNDERVLPKGGVEYLIKGYGYEHPNTFFINLFVLSLLIIVIYQKRLKSYIYILMTFSLFLAYKAVMNRTCWYLYLLLCVFLILYHLLKSTKYKKSFMALLLLLPVCIPLFSLAISFLYNDSNSFINMLDRIVTGRIYFSSMALDVIPISLFGNAATFLLDNAYLSLFVNYGIITFVLFIFLYFAAMFVLWKQEKDYELIMMGIFAIVGFMEVAMLHVFWNPFLLYVSLIIFNHANEGGKLNGAEEDKPVSEAGTLT